MKALQALIRCAQDEESVVAIGEAGGHKLLLLLMESADEEVAEVCMQPLR